MDASLIIWIPDALFCNNKVRRPIQGLLSEKLIRT